MPIDLAVLASTVVAQFLIPAAKKGLAKIGEDVQAKAGQVAAEGVEKVWNKVKSLFTSERDQKRWEDLEEYPEEAAPVITRVLEEKLAESPEVAQELDKIVHAEVPGSGGATLQNIMAEIFGFVDARHAQISGGQVAGVILGERRESRAEMDQTARSAIPGRPSIGGGGPTDR
jgi:hypothetical protein